MLVLDHNWVTDNEGGAGGWLPCGGCRLQDSWPYAWQGRSPGHVPLTSIQGRLDAVPWLLAGGPAAPCHIEAQQESVQFPIGVMGYCGTASRQPQPCLYLGVQLYSDFP